MFNQEINVTATCIAALANQPNSEEKIKLLLQSLFSSYSKEAEFNKQQNTETSVSSKLIFTQKELNQMPKTFKKEFRTDGCTAHVRKRKCGKNSYTYDIRYNRNGYYICVTNKNLETAKKLFIEKLKTATPVRKTTSTISSTLHAFTVYYFEKFRLPKVTKQTYDSDWQRYKKYIQPIFGNKHFNSITAEQCQTLIDQLIAQGKGKTAEEIYSLLSIIFKGAIAHGFMNKNPLTLVVKIKHQSKHGSALTKDEELLLLQAYPNTKYQTIFAIALYTGLRPNEYNTAKIEGKFIVAVNSKRKTKRVEYKRIPITPMLAPYLQNIKDFEHINRDVIREKFKAVLPNHILYDMRTTFYSRLKECGIADAARDEFVGHSLGALGNAYTDLSDEYLLREGAKFLY